MPLQITMADALTNQVSKQLIQRLQLGFWRIALLYIRCEALNDVRAG